VNPCEECGAPLRSKHVKEDPGDGTRRHGGKGLCTICYQAARKRPAQPPEHLTAYLSARKRRKKQAA
jgi:hypothetical protein